MTSPADHPLWQAYAAYYWTEYALKPPESVVSISNSLFKAFCAGAAASGPSEEVVALREALANALTAMTAWELIASEKGMDHDHLSVAIKEARAVLASARKEAR